MLGFEDQWPMAAMPDCSPTNDGLEDQLTATTPISSPVDYGSEYEPTPLEEDGSEHQPTSSDQDGSDYHPSSSEDGKSNSELRQPHKDNNDIQIHQVSVTLIHHHLRSDRDLEVGTVISRGETLELHDGSFLMTTELGQSRNGRSVNFVSHLFRPIEEFKDYLPVKFGSSELVRLCEAKEHDPEPKRYLGRARSEDVLRIRQLVLMNSECTPESFPQSRAAGIFTDPMPLICRWKLVAGLSGSHVMGGARRSRSIQNGSRRQPKAFIEPSSQELFVVGTLPADFFYSQHHLDSDPPEAWSDGGPSQSKTLGCATGRNPGTCKERRRDASRSLLLAPSTNGKRIVKATGKPAVRKSSCHLKLNLARMLAFSSVQKTASEQGIEPHIYTFADAFCGAGGMSVGTVREAACVKGLPADHAFCGSSPATRNQVANAVPSLVSKAILEEVLRSPMRTDALRRS